MPSWQDVPRAAPEARVGGSATTVVPLMLAVFLVVVGWWVPALLVVTATLVMQVVAHRRPSTHLRVLRFVARIGEVAAGAIGAGLLTLVHVMLIQPAAVISRVLRTHPFPSSRAWTRRRSMTYRMDRRSFALEPDQIEPGRTTPGGVLRLVPLAIGWIVLAGVANYVVGYAWDLAVDDNAAEMSIGSSGGSDLRAETPAFAGVPWAEDYLAELASLEYEYLPFIHSRMRPFDGEFISGRDGVRRSHQTVGEEDEVPVVWFLGGSTMWGEGQRDGHTIPSEIARLADEAGTPVRVVNLGERAYVSRQELELFDRELGRRPPPDLAVFYDGTNDLNVQRADFNEDRYLDGTPTIYDVDQVDRVLHGTPGDDRSLYDRYVRRSLVHELLDGVRDLFGGSEAAAADASEHDLVERTLAVYRRTRSLTRSSAVDADVATAFFWQPELAALDPNSAYSRTAEQVGAPTIDLSDSIPAADAEGVYIDGGHTNERGARLVAEAMWGHLAPIVERLTADR